MIREIQDDDILSIKDAAEYCGVAKQTIYNDISAGRGPAYTKPFGRLRFTGRAIKDYLERRNHQKAA